MTDLDRLTTALADRYRIERELGSGGMATVYLAEDVKHERKVAVKVLRPDLAAALGSERFLREIKIAAQLHHPHILPLHDSGETEGFLYYVMPYEEGQSLREKLAKEGELPVTDAVRILRDVVDALAHAHKQGVVHRDIKPDNVLLSDRHALVTDFGVAKAVSEATGRQQLTTAGVALGTPAYMAPEQAVADPHIDHRADVYAVGALAYELLTGQPPFTGPTPQMVLSAHVTEAPEPVTKYRESVPPALAQLVMKCLAKKPADRWQSTEELLPQLEALATPSVGMTPTDTEPVAVSPKPKLRSYRVAVFGGAAIILVVAASWFLGGFGQRGPARAADIPVLVVLPFENLGAAEDEYFADGITEEITSRLARLSGLGVKARTSAMQYKGTGKTIAQIGDELGVGYVLEGTVRWAKSPDGTSRVRISPQLIKVSDATHVWAETYEDALASVFQLQADVAQQIATALEVTLLEPERQTLAARPTDNLEAYDYFLRGNEHMRRVLVLEDVQEAERMYARAVELDPGFAQAHAMLSIARATQSWDFGLTEELPGATEAANMALQLAPEQPRSRLAMGYIYYYGRREYERALVELRRAQADDPNNPEILTAIGYVLRRQGKFEETVAVLNSAFALDPRSHEIAFALGLTSLYARNWADAERYLARAIAIAPDFPEAYVSLAITYLSWDESTTRARETIQRAAGRLEPTAVVLWHRMLSRVLAADYEDEMGRFAPEATGARYLLNKANLLLTQHDTILARVYFDSARVALETSLRNRDEEAIYSLQGSRSTRLGLAHAGLGHREEAVRYGERGVASLPVSRDAFVGPGVREYLAEIFTMVGEYDRAVDQLEYLFSIPFPISTGLVRLDPIWDPLRDHPRFQALLAKYEN